MKKTYFFAGMRHAIPIALGYIAVGFSVGIACRAVGLTPFQGFLISFLNNSSSGEYGGLTVIDQQAGLVEMAIVTLIVNARYLLMSFALSQRLSPDTKMWQRLLIGYDVTDELFSISIAQPKYIEPAYYIGAACLAIPSWSGGTFFGVIMGNLLPLRITSAFSVALYGMFIAAFIPPAKKDKVVLGCVCTAFVTSGLCYVLPVVSDLSSGTRTIILTIIIAGAAAVLFPRKEEGEQV